MDSLRPTLGEDKSVESRGSAAAPPGEGWLGMRDFEGH